MTWSHFGWDTANSRPILRVDDGRAVHGAEIVAYGADDQQADTMFAVEVCSRKGEKERTMTMRPEPMHVGFLRDVLEAGSLTLEVDDVQQGLYLHKEDREKLRGVKKEMEQSHSPML